MKKKASWEDAIREEVYLDKIGKQGGQKAIDAYNLHKACKLVLDKYKIVVLIYSIIICVSSFMKFGGWGGISSFVIAVFVAGSMIRHEDRLGDQFLEIYDPKWYMPGD